jgi:hypothetical protein
MSVLVALATPVSSAANLSAIAIQSSGIFMLMATLFPELFLGMSSNVAHCPSLSSFSQHTAFDAVFERRPNRNVELRATDPIMSSRAYLVVRRAHRSIVNVKKRTLRMRVPGAGRTTANELIDVALRNVDPLLGRRVKPRDHTKTRRDHPRTRLIPSGCLASRMNSIRIRMILPLPRLSSTSGP